MSVADDIGRHWPEHVECLGTAEPFRDPEHGVVCACGTILGVVVEEPPQVSPTYERAVDAAVEAIEALRTDPGPDPGFEGDDDACSAPLDGDATCNRPGVAEHYGACSAERALLAAHWLIRHDIPDELLDRASGVITHRGCRPPAVVDVELPAYADPDMLEDLAAQSAPPAEYRVGDTVTVAGMSFTKHAELPSPEDVFRGGDEAQALVREPEAPAQFPGPGMPARPVDVVPAEDPLGTRVVIIDPSQPYTPADVEAQLVEVLAKLERGMHYQRYWEERRYAAKMAHDIAHAHALLRARGAADQRKAFALVECQGEHRELELCEAMVRAVRETMHNLRSLQSGYQTTANSVRVHFQGTR